MHGWSLNVDKWKIKSEISMIRGIIAFGLRRVYKGSMFSMHEYFETFVVIDIFKFFLVTHRMQKLTQECLNWGYFIYKRIMH